jgi:hypothetical protein
MNQAAIDRRIAAIGVREARRRALARPASVR